MEAGMSQVVFLALWVTAWEEQGKQETETMKEDFHRDYGDREKSKWRRREQQNLVVMGCEGRRDGV